MRRYQQLNIKEREFIQSGFWEGRSLRQIAADLGRSHTTLSRELRKNFPAKLRAYSPRLAQERADERIQRRGQRPRLKDPQIRQYVEAKLKVRWSPEQIAGRMHIEHPDWKIVSHEAIYQYVYAPFDLNAPPPDNDLRSYLRRHHRIRKNKWVYHGNRAPIAGRISINERPAEVEQRLRIGDWEGDSIVSRQSQTCLNSLVERASGLLKLTRIENGKAEATASAVIRRFFEIPKHKRLTMTVDNGHEHANHLEVARQTGIKIFFCHPYHSWERGTNENTNGLVREYFPKKTDFALVSTAQIARVEAILNCRPRKRLGYLTPLEVFNRVGALKG